MLRLRLILCQYYFLLLAGLCFNLDLALASDQVSRPTMDEKITDIYSHKSLKNERPAVSYIVETSDKSSSESLNRISGNIDLGFSAPENSFKSQDHYGVGPFAKEEAEMNKSNSSQY